MKIELSWTILNDTERNWEYPFRCRLRIINVDRWISWTSRKETFGGRSQVCHNEAFSSHYSQEDYNAVPMLGGSRLQPFKSFQCSWNGMGNFDARRCRTLCPLVITEVFGSGPTGDVGFPREEGTSCHRILHHQLPLPTSKFQSCKCVASPPGDLKLASKTHCGTNLEPCGIFFCSWAIKLPVHLNRNSSCTCNTQYIIYVQLIVPRIRQPWGAHWDRSKDWALPWHFHVTGFINASATTHAENIHLWHPHVYMNFTRNARTQRTTADNSGQSQKHFRTCCGSVEPRSSDWHTAWFACVIYCTPQSLKGCLSAAVSPVKIREWTNKIR